MGDMQRRADRYIDKVFGKSAQQQAAEAAATPVKKSKLFRQLAHQRRQLANTRKGL